MSIRTLIVDDEDLARRGLRSLLRHAEDVEILGECRSGREAIEAIRRFEPDLVFLDVQMPGKNGFEVIAEIDEEKCPYVIFVTAFDKFALRAFDVHALDYLLKPLNEERLKAALARARATLASTRDESLISRFVQIASELRSARPDSPQLSTIDRLPVRDSGKVTAVRVADIDWVEASHNYVLLHVGDKSLILREPIASVEVRLAMSGFVRIHRSALVNVDRVRELRTRSKGEFDVVLHDGQQLKMTRNYRSAVERLVGLEV
jgi:two-component system, LytTR family, response regulator